MAYLDNNATTVMPEEVLCALRAGCNKGNPSATYASAEGCKQLMCKFAELIKSHCGAHEHEVIWCSGASEVNAMIVHSFVFAWRKIDPNRIPHFVVGCAEHKSLLDCVESYVEVGLATATIVPFRDGQAHIDPADVAAAITPDTCLVCVQHANNETGAINDIKECQRVAHSAGIPFYSDTVQSFGKNPMVPVDAFCISFHKCHGPPGVGALVIRKKLIEGHMLNGMIYGSQNNGLRGGTENMPGICGAFVATQQMIRTGPSRILHMESIKDILIRGLMDIRKVIMYSDYVRGGEKRGTDRAFVVFLDKQCGYLCNTLLLSVVNTARKVCNGEIKKALLARKFIVSIGSACNTTSQKASHVLYAMGASDIIRRGTIRVSWCHETTREQILGFLAAFREITAAIG